MRLRPDILASLARRAALCAAVAACALLAPASQAGEYGALEQINQQTQSLYREVQSGIVKVQLPTPQWVKEAAAKDDPAARWGQLVSPEVRKKLDEQRAAVLSGQAGKIGVVVAPSSQPTTLPGGWTGQLDPATGGTLLRPSETSGPLVLRAGAENPPGPALAPIRAGAAANFSPNNVGLLLDADGHLMIPLYIEPQTIGKNPVRVLVGDTESTATFIGSDEKTNVTILKLADNKLGAPLRMSPLRPADGSLVMMLNPSSGQARLTLWTNSDRDYGVVVNVDGTVAGFARYGQFLGGAACQPVIQQLIAKGRVDRAVIGARLTEVRSEDPVRRQIITLGDRPALHVDAVTQASPAEAGGLKAGDFILEFADQPVGDLTTWSGFAATPGTAKLRVLRDNKEQTVEVRFTPSSP